MTHLSNHKTIRRIINHTTTKTKRPQHVNHQDTPKKEEHGQDVEVSDPHDSVPTTRATPNRLATQQTPALPDEI
jgi:hypothetical protein